MIILKVFVFIGLLILAACNSSYQDQEGNHFEAVKIGSQVWIAENLNVSTFRNGDLIPEARTLEEWVKAGNKGQPVWCYYDNDPENGIKFGKLYNGYAVDDPRGLAPEGWRIPEDEDWIILSEFLGGVDFAGDKLKSDNHWQEQGNGNNESGFNALPGGYRYGDGHFGFIGYFSYWWASGDPDNQYAWGRGLGYSYYDIHRDFLHKNGGFSIRCIKE